MFHHVSCVDLADAFGIFWFVVVELSESFPNVPPPSRVGLFRLHGGSALACVESEASDAAHGRRGTLYRVIPKD